ncbi:MAG: CehA/McbA family metallohydrolase, partial [Candidatus Bathyarchaeia archaeon]
KGACVYQLVRLKIDMHVHTNYSDSKGTVEEVIKMAENNGLNGIAITDHNTLEGAKVAMEMRSNLIVIPGEEVETEKGDILALGIKEAIPANLPIEEAIHRVHLQGGLVFIPHPTIPFFGKLKESDMRRLPIDGLEVFSAISPFANHYASKNMDIAKRLGLPMIAGSDSHFPETVGDAYTIIEAEEATLPSILEALRLGRTELFCRPSKLRSKIKILRVVTKFFKF